MMDVENLDYEVNVVSTVIHFLSGFVPQKYKSSMNF